MFGQCQEDLSAVRLLLHAAFEFDILANQVHLPKPVP